MAKNTQTPNDYGPVRVVDTPDEMRLSIDWRYQKPPDSRNSDIWGSLVCLAVGSGLLALTIYGGASTLCAGGIGLIFFGVGLLIAFSALATKLNTTEIRITADTIQSKTGPLPFSSVLGADSFKQSADKVRQIIVERYNMSQDTGASSSGATDYSDEMYLVRLLNTDSSEHKLFMFYGPPGVASLIEQRIEDYLGIENDPNARPARDPNSLRDQAERLAGRDDTSR